MIRTLHPDIDADLAEDRAKLAELEGKIKQGMEPSRQNLGNIAHMGRRYSNRLAEIQFYRADGVPAYAWNESQPKEICVVCTCG